MSRRSSILGGPPATPAAPVKSGATIDSLYHQGLLAEMGAEAAANRRPQRDWGGFFASVIAMVAVGGLVLGGMYLYQRVDLSDLAFRKPVETESVTDRAWRIADRMRRPEDTAPQREPLAIDLAAERAAAAEAESAGPEGE